MTPERYEQVSEIFGGATEQPPEKQIEFVRQSCGDDTELRREVLSLLEHDHPEKDPPKSESSLPAAPPQPPRLSTVGQRMTPRRRLNLSVVPAIAAGVLAVIGIVVFFLVDRIQREQLEDKLTTVLDANAAAVNLWIEFFVETSERWAAHPIVLETAERAVILKQEGMGTVELLESDHNERFLEGIKPAQKLAQVRGIHLFNLNEGLLASTPVGEVHYDVKPTPAIMALIAQALEGEAVFSAPYLEHSRVENVQSAERVPIMSVFAPITGGKGKPVAAVMFRWRVDEDFARLLSMARLGDSGETYAFDEAGLVVSTLRQEDRLRKLGVIAPDAPPGTALNVSLRDPGKVLTAKQDADDTPRDSLPLTRMAAQATAGISGIDLEGYRDFTGRKVVGAWRWLDEYGIGIAAEIDYAEAHVAANAIRNVFVGLFALLITVSAVGIARDQIVYRLRAEVDQLREVGAYDIEGTVAAGGMGTVYRARHRLLKRPVAIKVIREDRVGPATIRRFKHEVRAMSQLTQPHTIQIFDFGVQPDGALYYAMEFLDGLSLQELVRREGALPWERVVYLLKQICISLIEAHEAGLIHRDIKPRNIMACCFGNQGDFVKVLDFGLVREVESDETSITSVTDVKFAGTPSFMAPECMRNPRAADPRSDLYSLGAVAYYLLTGEPAFRGVNAVDTCFRAMTERPPEIPGNGEIAPAISHLVGQLLAANPNERPATAAEVLVILEQIPSAGGWDRASAETWWRDD